MEIPHDEIRETLDRDWSFRLFDRLQHDDIDEDDADEIVSTLAQLEDPRLRSATNALATDRSVPSQIRGRMLKLMSEVSWSSGSDLSRRWWASGDELLQIEALKAATQAEADILRPVASDPLHPFYKHAIAGLELGLEAQEWQQYKIEALSHFDPEVRQTAAESLLWDQPLEAQDKLIEVAANDDDQVALEALFTLKFYENRSVLQALCELREHPDDDRAERADDYLREMATSFQSCRDQYFESDGGRRRFADWMAPIADVVALYSTNDPAYPTETQAVTLPEMAPPFQDVVDALDELGGRWKPKIEMFSGCDWSGYQEPGRRAFSSYLVNHPDPMVREEARKILVPWMDYEGLSLLAQDVEARIQAGARYALSTLPPRPEIATLVWPLIEGKMLSGSAADEALETWVTHFASDPSEVLIDLAFNDHRQSIREKGVDLLSRKHADRLEPILQERPMLTWSLHNSVLIAMKAAGLKPSVAHLRAVDDLHLATTLADLD